MTTIRLTLLLMLSVTAIWDMARAAAPQIPVLDWQPRSDWVNVRTAGTLHAAGDGAADDSDAIQAALNALRDGSTVYFPPGSYRITKTLSIIGPLTGITIIGHGRDTRLFWDGLAGGHMLLVNGVAYSRFIGFTLDGRSKAAAGLYHNSDRRFETEVRHQHIALLNFTDAGLLVDPARKLALAETMFENCLFDNCRRGAAFTQFNDYDYTFDGCEFRHCDTGVECAHGNFYIRNCHFEGSRVVDIAASPEHGSSVRRCTSSGSNAFLHFVQPVATMTVQDCRVSGWKSTAGTITLAGAPVILFDCVFTSPPDGSAPVRLLRQDQRLIVSENRVEGSPSVTPPGNHGHIYTIPAGRRTGSLHSADQHFLRETVRLPGRVFDARRDFGARGDGATDDSASIQKTIDAARAMGSSAMAYLPAGTYMISSPLRITGKDYFIGGSGWQTRLVWKGARGGTMVQIHNPRNVVLEQMTIGSQDAGAMENGVDIEQTGSGGPSSMTYDGVFVYGMYQRQPFRKGLRFSGLGEKDVVRLPHVQGNLHFVDCARATILANCSYEGSIVVEGKDRRRGGLLGFQTRLTTVCTHPLYLRDSQSMVMSDSYLEQADSGYLFEGSPGDPPGRATIQGAKVHFNAVKDNPDANIALEISNYRGQVFFGHCQFYVEPTRTRVQQQGQQPVDLFLIGDSFYNTWLDVRKTDSAHVFLLGDAVVGVPENKAPAGPLFTAEDTLPPGDLARLIPAFDDLRRLGEVDLHLNHGS